MIVYFRVEIPRLRTTQEGQEFCRLLADAMVESSANDGQDIKVIQYSVPKERASK